MTSFPPHPLFCLSLFHCCDNMPSARLPPPSLSSSPLNYLFFTPKSSLVKKMITIFDLVEGFNCRGVFVSFRATTSARCGGLGGQEGSIILTTLQHPQIIVVCNSPSSFCISCSSSYRLIKPIYNVSSKTCYYNFTIEIFENGLIWD